MLMTVAKTNPEGDFGKEPDWESSPLPPSTVKKDLSIVEEHQSLDIGKGQCTCVYSFGKNTRN